MFSMCKIDKEYSKLENALSSRHDDDDYGTFKTTLCAKFMIFPIYFVQTVQEARSNKQKHHDFHNKTISMALLFGFSFIFQSFEYANWLLLESQTVRQNKR